jgi:hypothetical protein
MEITRWLRILEEDSLQACIQRSIRSSFDLTFPYIICTVDLLFQAAEQEANSGLPELREVGVRDQHEQVGENETGSAPKRGLSDQPPPPHSKRHRAL